jgi:hypothetical protein
VNGAELYDMDKDPGEKQDIAAQNPQIVANLRKGYEDWFRDVSSVRNYVPPRIYIGTPHENPVVLTRQDWRVQSEEKRPTAGWWEVDVKQAGSYDITMTLEPVNGAGEASIDIGGVSRTAAVERGATECRFASVQLKAGAAQVKTMITTKAGGRGARFVEIRRNS